ncbi:hypothetical protein AALP_AA5G123600 [Arabis alpina]|uniref:NB-ARC domain-containing protein n=1 Tax=Arabis alpina TaxID=50452 RepID=A0A087GWM2_ARAAL|nr:hypothetical protein AALP_AA5G123600 [Arabis alpina]
MHDVVREMAIWIASDPEKHKEIWIVQAPKVKNWRDVRKISCICRNIENISGFRGLKESVRVLTLPTTCDLRRLTLEGCRMGEIKIERTISSLNNSPTIPCFSNRYGIYIGGCNHLKDLAWLVFAPNLVDLKVGSSNQLDDIINEEKATSVTGGHAGSIVPFQKLRRLWLSHLPMLKSIYWSPLPFPCINKIIIEDCPKLRKLPLGSESVVSNQELIIEYDEEEWIKEVAWEDEATQLRFLPSCKLQARPPPLGATSTSTFIATAIG